MQREKTALGYFVTNIFLLQKLLFRNPSWEIFVFFGGGFCIFWGDFVFFLGKKRGGGNFCIFWGGFLFLVGSFLI
jgi:hypothetical protein